MSITPLINFLRASTRDGKLVVGMFTCDLNDFGSATRRECAPARLGYLSSLMYDVTSEIVTELGRAKHSLEGLVITTFDKSGKLAYDADILSFPNRGPGPATVYYCLLAVKRVADSEAAMLVVSESCASKSKARHNAYAQLVYGCRLYRDKFPITTEIVGDELKTRVLIFTVNPAGGVKNSISIALDAPAAIPEFDKLETIPDSSGRAIFAIQITKVPAPTRGLPGTVVAEKECQDEKEAIAFFNRLSVGDDYVVGHPIPPAKKSKTDSGFVTSDSARAFFSGENLTAPTHLALAGREGNANSPDWFNSPSREPLSSTSTASGVTPLVAHPSFKGKAFWEHLLCGFPLESKKGLLLLDCGTGLYEHNVDKEEWDVIGFADNNGQTRPTITLMGWTARSDAADYMMTYAISALAFKGLLSNRKVLIVSRDKALLNLGDLLLSSGVDVTYVSELPPRTVRAEPVERRSKMLFGNELD